MLVTANVAPSSLILFTLVTLAIPSSEMSVLTKARRRHITKDGIRRIHCRENIKSYIFSEFSYPKWSKRRRCLIATAH
jgi:hypothetical protein